MAKAPAQHHNKIRMLADFFEIHDAPVVPDPYYGGEQGFENVLDLAEDACRGLIKHLRTVTTPS